ncbi:uncharacterized protein B0H64DRAFT_415168 [Chaetomium fimeti]|uniref:Uncharacterized protein n=1 Tax=Chaetomium fimeti TaxID=1854472 RepID=A0AAE0LV48_9PEZI|nr:hypothetical protein B0H64DRAFT_415168 [Chaetomium fimeti]
MFDCLPVEILSVICDYIGDSHPPSVLSLALTNKHCYSVACAFLYQAIAIEGCHPQQLALDAQKCEDLLRRDSAFCHVRRFAVYGRCEEPCLCDDSLERKRMPFQKLFWSPYDYNDNDGESPIVSFMDSLSFDHTAGEDIHQLDACWGSVCRLVRLLPALTDFIFALSHLMPPCLLETLHNQFAASSPIRLRLHIIDFGLPNLEDGRSDPQELSLASSPLLHRIWARYCDTDGYDRESRPSYDAEIAMELVEGFAPNLKDVRLFHDWGNSHGVDLPRPAWKRFSKAAITSGSLQKLDLDGTRLYYEFREVPKEVLQRWETSTDFSVLQTLNLRQRLDLAGLTFLAECCSFPNLTSLTLYYDPGEGQAGTEPLHKFLCALPNLRSLALLGDCAQTVHATAFNPGLRRLRLPTTAGASYHRQLRSIVERCGADEVDLYRTVGRLPRLRHLDLSLDASSPTPETRYFVPQHAHPLRVREVLHLDYASPLSPIHYSPNRPVFNALVDSAADEKLALAIFKAVSQGKKNPVGAANTAAVPLESLALRGQYVSRTLGPYIRVMARPWRVTRDPRDDRRDVLHAARIDPDPEPAGLALWEGEGEGEGEGLERDVLAVFRQLWPEKAPGSNWFEDWESWPLEGVDDE